MFQLPSRQRSGQEQAFTTSHAHSRTVSSNVFPAAGFSTSSPMQLSQPPVSSQNRRSPSVNTFSTVSSSGMAPPAAYRTSPTSDIRRSSSSRSDGLSGATIAQPPSYVALLRRQKATVWSERAQFEDPRMVAQQRAARIRANREIVASGGYVTTSGSGRTSTGLSAGGKVAAKIRHHKGSALGFGSDSNYVGIGGVPLRLSATEVEGEDSDEDDYNNLTSSGRLHRRTGSSGRNSTASGRRGPPYRTSSGALGASRRYSPGDTPERTGSLVEGTATVGAGSNTNSSSQADLGDGASAKAHSTASGSSAERADNVPDLTMASGRIPANSASHAATITREKSLRTPEDLRRRGSVDERTMTMSTGRLFIANPD